MVQPFAFRTFLPGSKQFNLPIGPMLKARLDDPLKGAKFDLTLPFRDPNVALSDGSAIIRSATNELAWHVAVDFDHNTHYNDSAGQFDVVVAADGFVESTSTNSTAIVIRHTAANGEQFHTIYQHMIPASRLNATNGTPVKRGQKLGQIDLVTTSGGKYCSRGTGCRGRRRAVDFNT